MEPNIDSIPTTHYTEDSLRTFLNEHHIDTTLWGQGGMKTVGHLLKEIEEGDSVLTVDGSGNLLRHTSVTTAQVYYENEVHEKMHLVEDRQVFTDGRERKREMKESVAEKMKADEDPEKAIARGISEELGISGAFSVEKLNSTEETMESKSYPGLTAQFIRHNFQILLQKEQFKPEGYTEVQKDKTTYFVWQKV